MNPTDEQPPGALRNAPTQDSRATRWLVYALAWGWCVFAGTVTAHETPAWSLTKKIACTISAFLILILLIATRRKGNIGCAILFLLTATFILGAVWCYVWTVGNDGSIRPSELDPLR
jgi:hypothetical protein